MGENFEEKTGFWGKNRILRKKQNLRFYVRNQKDSMSVCDWQQPPQDGHSRSSVLLVLNSRESLHDSTVESSDISFLVRFANNHISNAIGCQLKHVQIPNVFDNVRRGRSTIELTYPVVDHNGVYSADGESATVSFTVDPSFYTAAEFVTWRSMRLLTSRGTIDRPSSHGITQTMHNGRKAYILHSQ